jgi:hypothetical protein
MRPDFILLWAYLFEWRNMINGTVYIPQWISE